MQTERGCLVALQCKPTQPASPAHRASETVPSQSQRRIHNHLQSPDQSDEAAHSTTSCVSVLETRVFFSSKRLRKEPPLIGQSSLLASFGQSGRLFTQPLRIKNTHLYPFHTAWIRSLANQSQTGALPRGWFFNATASGKKYTLCWRTAAAYHLSALF